MFSGPSGLPYCGDLDGQKVCLLILTLRDSITLITFSFNTIPNNDISLNVIILKSNTNIILCIFRNRQKEKSFRSAYGDLETYLINVTPMFSHFQAKTSPRLPSRFEVTYNFCVEIRPDFPVPYLTLKEHLHIRQQSFVRFTLFFTGFFGVSAQSMKKGPPSSSKVSTSNALSCLFTFCFAPIG